VVQWVVDAAERLSVNLTPDRDPIPEPAALRRSDGTSVYRHTGGDHFTTARVLEAEQRLVAAAGLTGGFAFPPEEVEIAICAAVVEGDRLNRGQRDLLRSLASSDRRVRLALAPAGSGKTTAMKVLARVWTDNGYEAIGLAPSAAAAAVLHESTGMSCETQRPSRAALDPLPSPGLQRRKNRKTFTSTWSAMETTPVPLRLALHLKHGHSRRQRALRPSGHAADSVRCGHPDMPQTACAAAIRTCRRQRALRPSGHAADSVRCGQPELEPRGGNRSLVLGPRESRPT
jgi:hypothetical protein